MTVLEIYEDLWLACEHRGLQLELHVATKRHGDTDGFEWRDLKRLDVTTADGRTTLFSALIVPGDSGGLAGAAALALELMTTA